MFLWAVRSVHIRGLPPSVDCYHPWFAALRQNLAIPHPSYPSLFGYRLVIGWWKFGECGRAPSPTFLGQPRVVSSVTRVYVPASRTSWLAGPARERTAAFWPPPPGVHRSREWWYSKNSIWFVAFEILVLEFGLPFPSPLVARAVGTLAGPQCVFAVRSACAATPFHHVNLLVFPLLLCFY